jgi:hypothetical protein
MKTDEVHLVTPNTVRVHNKRGVLLYNVHFKDGSLANRVSERDICGLRPEDIAWVWNVSERRRVSPEEIQNLCKLSSDV